MKKILLVLAALAALSVPALATVNAYWKGDSNGQLLDATGKGNALTAVGSLDNPGTPLPPQGNLWLFQGPADGADYFKAPAGAYTSDVSGQLSLYFWVQSDLGAGTPGGLMSIDTGVSGANHIGLEINTGGYLSLSYTSNTAYKVTATAVSVTDGDSHLVRLWSSNVSGMFLSVDGVLQCRDANGLKLGQFYRMVLGYETKDKVYTDDSTLVDAVQIGDSASDAYLGPSTPNTPTLTPTLPGTLTSTPTPTITPSFTPNSGQLSASQTPTFSFSPTWTPTSTRTKTKTPTPSDTRTPTKTPTPTPTPSPTFTITKTITRTNTPTLSPTPRLTSTPYPTGTAVPPEKVVVTDLNGNTIVGLYAITNTAGLATSANQSLQYGAESNTAASMLGLVQTVPELPNYSCATIFVAGSPYATYLTDSVQAKYILSLSPTSDAASTFWQVESTSWTAGTAWQPWPSIGLFELGYDDLMGNWLKVEGVGSTVTAKVIIKPTPTPHP